MPKNNKKKQSKGKTTKKVTNASEELKKNETEKAVEKEEIKTAEANVESTKQAVEDTKNSKTDKKSKKNNKDNKQAKKDKQSKKDKSTKKSWFKDFKAELKKVVWPKGKELFSNTAVVIVMVIIVSVFIFILDLAFDYMNKFEVEQVKKLQNSISVNETVDNTTDTNTTNVVDENNTVDTNIAAENTVSE